MFRKLFFKLYLALLLTAVLTLGGTLLFVLGSFKDFYYKRTEEGLQGKMQLARSFIEKDLSGKKADPAFSSECKDFAAKAEARLTVIEKDGTVIFDSEANPAEMVNHASRPEFSSALLESKRGVSVRYSSTLKTYFMYVAEPLKKNNEIIGAFRLSMPLSSLNSMINSFYSDLFKIALVIALAAILISFFISMTIARPIEMLKERAGKIASGNLDERLEVPESEEIGELAKALNYMAEELKKRLREITSERNRNEAILSSMTEGLIAVSPDSEIIKVNKAASRILSIPENSEGKTVHEAVRNSSLQNFADKLLRENSVLEDELIFYNHEQHHLQVCGSQLRDESGKLIGGLIVLNDITRIKQLENFRKDFVANVSHEIKTPLTAIKGSVETLIEGNAIHNPVDAEKFLSIIVKHTERLNALVEDILSLSAIERETAAGEFNFADVPVKDIVNNSAELCKVKAEARKINIVCTCPEDIYIRADKGMMEQALVNLIDNAIKYSNENSNIDVQVEKDSKSIILSVNDYGCGIPKEHIPRLFERFYRVDKARSRKLGGTGLGLAIVKHLVHGHNGTVAVDSIPGKGSSFRLILPL